MSPNLTQLLKQQSAPEDETWQPVFYRLSKDEDAVALEQLLSNNPNILVRDQILLQLKDLVKLENPQKTLSEDEYDNLIRGKLKTHSSDKYGVWVYYPWKREIVHLLDEEEFIRVRTIRNAYKITFEEQALLRTKKIGVIGLSVGQSAAITIAIERIAGEIRLADFDHIELSNLNRIRTSISNLNSAKTKIVAREISEIDPFIKIKIFQDGINDKNIASFLSSGSNLDLLIEECDSVDIKILSRIEARRLKIPVIMDTSDRGLIDIERFDKTPDYPILHGLIPDNISFELFKSLTTAEEKLPYLIPFSGLDSLSVRMKASALELGSSITTWPQLGSDVIFGGVLCSVVAKKVLLDYEAPSGRYWNDLFPNFHEHSNIQWVHHKDEQLASSDIISIDFDKYINSSQEISKENLHSILLKGTLAPSAGNSQKWKFVIRKYNIFLVMDRPKNTQIAGDNRNISSYLSFGAVLENMILESDKLGYELKTRIFEEESYPLIFQCTILKKIKNTNSFGNLSEQIPLRCSSRLIGKPFELSGLQKDFLIPFSKNEDFKVKLITNKNDILNIGEIICEIDRIRILNYFCHVEFFNQELKWQNEASMEEGIHVNELNLEFRDKIGLQLASDYKAINLLKELNLGRGFERLSKSHVENTAAFAAVLIPSPTKETYIEAGRILERFWLTCTELELGVHPMSAITLLSKLSNDNASKFLDLNEKSQIDKNMAALDELIGLSNSEHLCFLLRIHGAVDRANFKKRKKLNKVIIDL